LRDEYCAYFSTYHMNAQKKEVILETAGSQNSKSDTENILCV
jgi:hypothetical protein